MKCTIPEISWHNRDPVLSVDVQPIINSEFYRLASGGTDSHVLIWHLKILETGATSVEPVCDLTRHQRAVNVVRWSPTGQYLASGDDDANIIIWHQKADELAAMLDGETPDKEKWSIFKILRGHKEDVYDISWSPNSQKLLSGSVDNTAIVWDLAKGTNDNILKDHKGFVQGVSWDPQGQFLATLSSDRKCRIFSETGRQVRFRISKGCLDVPETHPLHGQVVRYYHDDTLKSFFRRLSFSPDGNLLITPAGCLDSGQPNKCLYTTYIYDANSFMQPAAILPSPGQYTVAVRCSPVLYELRAEAPDPIIVLPYRMVIAVATRSSVVLYDTQQLTPFAVISNIHYTRLTDLTWSQDGRILAVSSTDGFCSLVTFEVEELGKEYVKEESDEEIVDQGVSEEVENAVEEKVEEKKEVKKKPSFLKKWASKKKITKDIEIKKAEKVSNPIKETNSNVILIEDSPPTKKHASSEDSPNVLPVKRKLMNHSKFAGTPAKPIAVRRKPRDELETSSPSASSTPTKSAKKKPQEQPDTNSPSTKNSTPAKPIAVRRKPRDQMDIKQFLKSPNEPPKKKPALAKDEKDVTNTKPDVKPEIISEDSVAQDAWVCNEKMDVDETKSGEVITIEDTQDLKLALESDTVLSNDKCSRSLEDFEKFHEKQNKADSENNMNVSDEYMEILDSDEEANRDREKSEKKENSHNETENKIESKETGSTSANSLGASSKINDVKNKINDLQIQSGVVTRKKVPFITLSSPKSKKKENS